MIEEQIHVRSRGHLPHWERAEACYFVTFRLADSLPRAVVEEIESTKNSIVETARQQGRILTRDEKRKLSRLTAIRVEKCLDSGAGACHLASPPIARLTVKTLLHFEGQRYKLFAWCVMPNHVHVVVQPFPAFPLASILHSWKTFVARTVNKILGREGAFWEREYYDHLVRNEGDLARVARYVAGNPARAGLDTWPWVWIDPTILL